MCTTTHLPGYGFIGSRAIPSEPENNFRREVTKDFPFSIELVFVALIFQGALTSTRLPAYIFVCPTTKARSVNFEGGNKGNSVAGSFRAVLDRGIRVTWILRIRSARPNVTNDRCVRIQFDGSKQTAHGTGGRSHVDTWEPSKREPAYKKYVTYFMRASTKRLGLQHNLTTRPASRR